MINFQRSYFSLWLKTTALAVTSGAAITAFVIFRQRRQPVILSVYADSHEIWATQPMSLTWAWEAATQAYCQAYIDAVRFSFRLNGEPLEIVFDTPMIVQGRWATARWFSAPFHLPKGHHDLTLIAHLSRAVSDGSDQNDDGQLDTYGPGEIASKPCVIWVK